MKRFNKYLYQLSFLCLLMPAPAAWAVEGWITLLDGTTGMENFDHLGEANWTAVDGAIQATEGPGGAAFLVTKEDYGDFSLRIEFWASDDANSGIFMRCQDRSNVNDRNCYEANIYDQRPDPTYGTGGIVHVGPLSDYRPMAGGQWNTFEITLQGSRLMAVFNGQTTVDVQDSQFASGAIALQWGRGTIRFRKVEILPL